LRPCAPEPLAIGVNDLAQARAVLAWAAAGGHGAVRLYGLDARFMGAGFWSEVERLLGRPLVVDCDGHVGTALEALRVGCGRLRVTADGPQERALAGLVHAYGAVRISVPPALRLRPGRPVAGQLARARCEQVTGAFRPVKQPGDACGVRSTKGHLGCD